VELGETDAELAEATRIASALEPPLLKLRLLA